jgi:chemotaxis protein methyltransferase CheR
VSLQLAPFKTLVQEHCGLACTGNSEGKLAQALAERSAALAIEPAAYYARLAADANEFQQLVNLLTINETYFFREPEHIRLLVDRLAPRLLAAHGGETPVRILSAGCSSGEEPYSLVMALTDRYGESVARLFSFDGGDIDSGVLAKARQACYSDFSFRGVPDEVRERYFDRDRRGYVLKEEVKRQVGFHELNLLTGPFPPALRDFDVIFFRNVSIYFDTPTRLRIQQTLASLLNDDGVLIIGSAETLANDLGVLPLVEEAGVYYLHKGQAAPPPTQLFTPPCPPPCPAFAGRQPAVISAPAAAAIVRTAPMRDWPAPTAAAVAPTPTPTPELDSARQLMRDKRYDEARTPLDAVLDVAPGNVEAQLLKAHLLLNRQDFAAAEELAQRVLATDAWSIDALLLLGLAAKWQQQNATAIRWLKQAAYARHGCWPAHYYLADLYRHDGETELARRAYRVVLQLLAGAAPDTGIQYVALGLSTSEIRFLCTHQLTRLPARALAGRP